MFNNDLTTRVRSILVAAPLAWLAACLVPTDDSDKLAVQMDAVPVLIENDSLVLSARVMQGDVLIPNAEVRYSTDNSIVLSVSPDGELRAIRDGTANVTATAITFAGAEAVEQLVVVRPEFALDSVQPTAVRYGELLEIFGVGLNQAFQSQFGGGADGIVHGWVPTDPGEIDRFGSLFIWSAPPAERSDVVILVGFGGVLVSDPIQVFQRDIYEPNDSAPSDLGTLDGRVFNPGLAFERVLREDGRLTVDWYTFTIPQTGDWTISVSAPLGGGIYDAYLTNELFWIPGTIEASGFAVYAATDWGVGAGFRPCDGLGFIYPGPDREAGFTIEVPPDSAIIPIKDLPAGTYNLIVTFGQDAPFYDLQTNVSGVVVDVDSVAFFNPRRTGIDIRPGYRSILPPDAYEENDYCDVASNISVPDTIANLTIDAPHDADWFHFTLTSPQNVGFSVTAADSFASLDLYLIQDFRPDSLIVKAFSFDDGVTNQATTANLAPGDYFLIVTDFIGLPTDYTLNAEILTGIPAPAQLQSARAKLEERQKKAGVRRLNLPAGVRRN